jgi:hypothetical protein
MQLADRRSGKADVNRDHVAAALRRRNGRPVHDDPLDRCSGWKPDEESRSRPHRTAHTRQLEDPVT